MNTNANTTVLTAEEINEHRMARDNGKPAIYVSTYNKYNIGSLKGLWIDLSSFECEEDVYNFCIELHCDDEDPVMIQDYMNFPNRFYCESYSRTLMNDLFEWIEMDEREKEIVSEYWEEVYEKESIENILESLVYEGEFSDYAYEIAKETISCNNATDTILEKYFDYAAFERDLKFDYNVTENYVFSK